MNNFDEKLRDNEDTNNDIPSESLCINYEKSYAEFVPPGNENTVITSPSRSNLQTSTNEVNCGVIRHRDGFLVL